MTDQQSQPKIKGQMKNGYKFPQKNTCDKCAGFKDVCTFYPKEEWPMLWLTNECGKFEPKVEEVE